MQAPRVRSPPKLDALRGSAALIGTDDREVAVMRERLRSTRSYSLLGFLALGASLNGCAAATQDVHAYYRQMAYNWHEAGAKAKIDEGSLQNMSRMLLATGDTRKYRKAQRELEDIRSWEQKCVKQEDRFEKAAVWMENHFDLKKSGTNSKADAPLPLDFPLEPSSSGASVSMQPNTTDR
jgi:hypothetical protein